MLVPMWLCAGQACVGVWCGERAGCHAAVTWLALQVEKLEEQIRSFTQDPKAKGEKDAIVISTRGQGVEPPAAPSRGEKSGDESGNSVSASRSGYSARRGAAGTPSVGRSSTVGGAVRRARSASPVNLTPSLQKALTKGTMGVGDRFRTARPVDPGKHHCIGCITVLFRLLIGSGALLPRPGLVPLRFGVQHCSRACAVGGAAPWASPRPHSHHTAGGCCARCLPSDGCMQRRPGIPAFLLCHLSQAWQRTPTWTRPCSPSVSIFHRTV